MTVTVIFQIISIMGLLAAGFLSRRRDRREISRLASELSACRVTLQDFMQETEATFGVFSRMVHKAESSPVTRLAPPKTGRILPEPAPAKTTAVAAAEKPSLAVATSDAAGKKTQVLNLADKGMTSAEIASQLTIPHGEIDLILNLNRQAARY